MLKSEEVRTENLDHLGLVAGMCEELKIKSLIDNLIPCESAEQKVSTGTAILAMIQNGLGYVNKSLYMVSNFFENKPVDRLLGENLEASDLNDDTLGRALERIHAFGTTQLYSKLAVEEVKTLGLSCKAGSMDSTNFHLHGQYNSQKKGDASLHITKGYSKDHRPDLNQVALQLIIDQKSRIPLVMQSLSGNSEDTTSFRAMVNAHVGNLHTDLGMEFLVADSKLYTKETIQDLDQLNVKWISRVPSSVGEVKKLIECTDKKELEALSEKGYYGKWYTSNYGGVSQRWLLVFSQKAYEREVKAKRKQIDKGAEKEEKAFKKLIKKAFSCQKDALNTLEEFKRQAKYSFLSEEKIKQKKCYAKVGKPTKNTPVLEIKYFIEAKHTPQTTFNESDLKKLGFFVLATNELEKTSKTELLHAYKEQNTIERGFRFMKSPELMTSSFFVQKTERLDALLMIMTLCLLVYAALEYKIRKSLVEHNQYFENQLGKEVRNPTARWIFECFQGIHVLFIVTTKRSIVTNLKQKHIGLLNILGKGYEHFYS